MHALLGCTFPVVAFVCSLNIELHELFAYFGPLQYSCLENPIDGGAWWAAVHGVATSRTRLSDFTFIQNYKQEIQGEEKLWLIEKQALCLPTVHTKLKVKSLSRVRLVATPWTAAYQAPPSMGFSMQPNGLLCKFVFHL